MTLQHQLQNPKYRQWLKAGLSFKYMKDGIQPFTVETAKDEHTQLLYKLGVSPGQRCNSGCTLISLKPDHTSIPGRVPKCPLRQKSCNCLFPGGKRSCPNNICSRVYDEIVRNHVTSSPNWRNSDISKWCTDYWEIAKCFIHTNRYSGMTVYDTDIRGIFQVYINNTAFRNALGPHVQTISRILPRRNQLIHSAKMELGEADLKECIIDMIAVLSNVQIFLYPDAQKAIKNLQELLNDDFQVLLDDSKNEQELQKDLSELREDEDNKDVPEDQIYSLLPPEILRMDKRSIDLYKKALAEGKEASYIIRIMVVGHVGVGKTTLTKRLLGEKVHIGSREITNGIEVHVRRCTVDLDSGKWIVSDKDGAEGTVYHRLAKLLSQIHLDDQPEVFAIVGKDNQQSKENKQTEIYEVEDHLSEKQDDLNIGVSSDSSIQNLFDPQSKSESCTDASRDALDKNEVLDKALFTQLQELVKEIKGSTADDACSSSAEISIWDFAGQYAFYTTHQVFLSRRAIYLLVTDVSKLTDDIIIEDECYLDSKGGTQCKISDYVKFWLKSIHEFCSSKDKKGPPVILVGTFADILKKKQQDNYQEAVNDFFFKLRCSLVDDVTNWYLIEEDFAIDNTQASEELEDVTNCHLIEEDFAIDNTQASEELDALKAKLLETAAKQDYWGEVIPAKWITLEKILINLKSEGRKVIEKTTVLELNSTMPVPIETHEELELFLNFHHEYGDLIYYSHDDRLSETVLLDPQWLVDAFKCILTAKMFCSRHPDVLKQWIEFERSGVISVKLIETIWNRDVNFRDHTVLLLEYLEKLGLLAKPCQRKDQCSQKNDYFAPSVLKDSPPEDVLKCPDDFTTSTSSRLCLTTPSRFLPTAVFNKLLAACIEMFPLCRNNDKRMIFCGCGVFELEKNHRMCIYFYDNVIQMWVIRYSSDKQEPDTELCLKVRDFVMGVLNQQVHKVILNIRCPRADCYSNSNMFLVDEIMRQEEVLCCCQGSPPHVVKTVDIMSCWLAKDKASEIERLSDRDLRRIASHIGNEWESLGLELELSKVEIDHICSEYRNRNMVYMITAMLIKWRDRNPKKGTLQELRNAMTQVGSDIHAAFASVDRR